MAKFVLTHPRLTGSSPDAHGEQRLRRVCGPQVARFQRAVALVLVATQFLTLQPVLIYATAEPKASAAPATPVAGIEKREIQAPVAPPNRTLPDIGSEPAKPMTLPDTPTDAEITARGGFIEPLVPIGGRTTPADNKALAVLLGAWRARADLEDFTLIDQFVGQHQKSPWVAALLLNKGLECRKRGYFSVALTAWQEAWSRARNETSSSGHALADRAAGELAELNARLGRYEWLEPFFQEIEGRSFQGSASEKIAGARQGLWLMQNRPEDAFRCGPMALDRIRARENPALAFDPKVIASRSTLKGMSLTDVNALAKELGMDYTMVKRDPGASMVAIVPAVIHWKVGHYAALTGQNDGRYRVEDPTFGDAVSVSPRVIDTEASGYFLVPTTSVANLPLGWRVLKTDEGKQVWGKGNTGANDPNRTGDQDQKVKKCPPYDGMAQYNVHAMAVSLNIKDRPLGYTPPRGLPIAFTVTYSQREANQPANFSYSNLGRKWTHDWFSYVQDDTTSASNPPIIYLRGGGTEIYPELAVDVVDGVPYQRVTYDYDDAFTPPLQHVRTAEYKPQQESRATLFKTDFRRYEKVYPDGSKEVFDHLATDLALLYSRKIFLTKQIDAAGNETVFTYDTQHRLRAVTDAIGQVTTLQYADSTDPLRITSVTDPFSRMALLEYNPDGQLKKITDVAGITSEFTYLAGDFINTLKTGYGTTTFSFGEEGTTRWLDVTDAEGNKERTEYRHYAPGIPFSDPYEDTPQGVPTFNAYLVNRNTFYFSKKAYQEAYQDGSFDYTKARIYHWLHAVDMNVCSGILESTKEPKEARVWRFYQGQTNAGFMNPTMQTQPASIARRLDDGTTQIYRYEYNDAGRVTRSIDPLGRETTFIYYPNLIDLKEVRQKRGASTDLLASYTYNENHQPRFITDAAAQTTEFIYNSFGQIETTQDALGHITTFGYDSIGYLKTITGTNPAAIVNLEYDGYGRVRQVRNSDNYTVDTEYDALNRPNRKTYPDGTYEQTIYTLLNVEWTRDRLGRWTHTYFNSSQQVVGVEDPEYRFTGYEWCGCGGLSAIIDPLGRVTSWISDAQGRVVSKIYPDHRAETYQYEPKSGRLSTVTDATGRKQYQYYPDDALKQVDYNGGGRARVVVNYTYEADYPRLATMIDGQGATAYTYKPTAALGAGNVATIDGPLANDTITLSYDELGRAAGRSVNGVADTPHYDVLGRVDSVTNALGTFGYHYDGVTSRLTAIDIPNGGQATFGYNDNVGDRALSNITQLNSGGGVVSKFDYTYSGPGRIGEWTQQQGNQPVVKYVFGYNDVDELKDATGRDVSTQAPLKHYAYDYDSAGNRTTEQIDNLVATEVPNQLNQMTRRTAGGQLKVRGALTEPASVTVNGVLAAVGVNNQFEGSVNVSSGDNQLEVVATDGNGNITTQRYQVNVPTAAGVTQQYDANGNLTRKATGPNAITYEWDAANRLVAINTGTARSEFEYDGLNRRVRIVEKESGAVISEKRFVWADLTLAEERDESGANVTKRFFDQGVHVVGEGSGGKYYYSRDHLGSVRELIESAGAIRARYDYEPTGRRTRIEGGADADFGFTGHYYHQSSGLHLAVYRAYDAGTAKWLNRDPVAERGGLNLYGYVGNSPANRTDPLGLWYWNDPATWFDGGGYEGTSDYSNYRYTDLEEAAMATLDGIIPFADPFGDNGGYDPCDPLLRFSQSAAQFARNLYTGRLLLGGLARLGGTRWGNNVLNSNRYLRIGPGRMPANGRFPSSTNAPRISIGRGPGNPHIDLRP
jgi:RHS repeat-associated protein